MKYDAPWDCETLLCTLLQKLQVFEGKVGALEQRCGQIRQGLRSIAQELAAAREALAEPGERRAGSERDVTLHQLVERAGMTDHVDFPGERGQEPDLVIHQPGGGTIHATYVSAEASTLFLLLRCVGLKWLSLTCARDARSFVNAGQDLVEDFSAFISDFTDSENGLCDLVESFARVARSPSVAPLS